MTPDPELLDGGPGHADASPTDRPEAAPGEPAPAREPRAAHDPEAAGEPRAAHDPEAAAEQLPSRVAWALPAAGAFAICLALQASTLMPGLGYWDTAEFQALGPVLGIAHPTGYPSYTLLLWLASVVLGPFGDPALRANLLSALLTSGAAALTAIAIVQLTRRPAIALAGAVALGLSPIAWQNAVRADPHPFHLFLVALLLVCLLGWSARERGGLPGSGRWLLAASAVYAVAVGNHALSLLLAPGIGIYVLLVSPRILWRRWRLVLGCGLVLVGLTVAIYAYLPLRSMMEPPLDYAHPADWVRTDASGRVTGGFRYLVLGEQFRGTFQPLPSLVEGARAVLDVLVANLGPAGWLAVLGLPLGFLRRPREMVLTIAWFVMTWVFSLGYLNAAIERYYLVPLLVGVLWAALAIDALWMLAVAAWRGYRPPAAGAGPSRTLRRALIVLAAAILLLPVVAPIPGRRDEVDASDDRSARAWLDATLAALPKDAVVISWWSYSTPLWYGRFVEGRRPDLTIIDDRTILDGDLGNVPGTIERYLGERPVFVVRLDRDLGEIEERWELEQVPGIPSGQRVFRVIDPAGASGDGV